MDHKHKEVLIAKLKEAREYALSRRKAEGIKKQAEKREQRKQRRKEKGETVSQCE